MYVDSHLHVGFRGWSAEDIVAYLDANGIDLCWLLTWEESFPIDSTYEHLSIEDVFSAYEKYPSRIVPMYAPDPKRGDFEELLESWFRKGVRDIGELKVRLSWDSPYIERLLVEASRLGLPVLFHMTDEVEYYRASSSSALDALFCKLLNTKKLRSLPGAGLRMLARVSRAVRGRMARCRSSIPGYLWDFASLERRLEQFPDVVFIGHGPMFWRGISADLGRSGYPKSRIRDEGVVWKLLSAHDNLFADVSGPSGYNALARDLNAAKRFLSNYCHKILFGTDNYCLGLRSLLDGLCLENAARERILGKNAERILETVGVGA